MEGTTQTEARVTCEYCSEIISAQDQNCASCGYPIKGNKDEQRQFISLKGRLKHELKELKTKVENAQITFYVLSGLFFLNSAKAASHSFLNSCQTNSSVCFTVSTL